MLPMRTFFITLIFFYKLLGDTHEPHTMSQHFYSYGNEVWCWKGEGCVRPQVESGCDYTGTGRMIDTGYSKTRDFI